MTHHYTRVQTAIAGRLPFSPLLRSFFRPFGALALGSLYPRLTPLRQAQGKLWAVFFLFFRRFAAGDVDCAGRL